MYLVGVLGVARDSFKVFFKDPSRRNVFLQTVEVDRIESRCSNLYNWSLMKLPFLGNRIGYSVSSSPLQPLGKKCKWGNIHWPKFNVSETFLLIHFFIHPLSTLRPLKNFKISLVSHHIVNIATHFLLHAQVFCQTMEVQKMARKCDHDGTWTIIFSCRLVAEEKAPRSRVSRHSSE